MREDTWAHFAQGVLSAELDAAEAQIQRHLRLMQLAAPLVAVLSGASLPKLQGFFFFNGGCAVVLWWFYGDFVVVLW